LPFKYLLQVDEGSSAVARPAAALVVNTHQLASQAMRTRQRRRANLGYQLWGLSILFLLMEQWHILTAPPEIQKKRSDF
jgi:hypothetical protein